MDRGVSDRVFRCRARLWGRAFGSAGRARGAYPPGVMRASLDRLRTMSGAELTWRARTAGRTLAQSVAVSLRAPRWQPARIAHILDPSLLDADTNAAIARGDWGYLHDVLART